EVAWIVQADPLRLKAALLDLLANAVRFSRVGGSVDLACAANAPGRLRIGVSDTGRGFTPEDLAKLFQPFASHANEAAVEEGIGIGLMVCRLTVEMMGGELGAASTVGLGSVFWIELNLAAARPDVPVPVQRLTGEPSGAPV